MAHQKNITVVGAGLMGSALARGFAEADHQVRIWNRTYEKAQAVGGGVEPVPQLADAIRGSDLVVVSVTDYDAAKEILDRPEISEAFGDATFVQITSGTPTQARSGAEWASKNNIPYLDAKILGYPSSVRTEWATVFYAGKKDIYDAFEPVFKDIAENSVYVSEEVGSASVIDCAVLVAYYGGSIAALQGAAMCAAEGIDPKEFFKYKDTYLGLISVTSDAAQEMIAANDFSGDQCSVATHVGALTHIANLTREAGINTGLTDQLLRSYGQSVEAGRGEEELATVYRNIMQP